MMGLPLKDHVSNYGEILGLMGFIGLDVGKYRFKFEFPCKKITAEFGTEFGIIFGTEVWI